MHEDTPLDTPGTRRRLAHGSTLRDPVCQRISLQRKPAHTPEHGDTSGTTRVTCRAEELVGRGEKVTVAAPVQGKSPVVGIDRRPYFVNVNVETAAEFKPAIRTTTDRPREPVSPAGGVEVEEVRSPMVCPLTG